MMVRYTTEEDGNYEFYSLTADTLSEAMRIMSEVFLIEENVAIAVQLKDSPNAVEELEPIILHAAVDGVSVVAVDKRSGEVVGASINKLIYNQGHEDEEYLKAYYHNCKEPAAKNLVQFMLDADAEWDLFDLCDIDCIMEIMFLAILPEHRGNGLASKLTEISIQLGKDLLAGNDVRVAVNEQTLPPAPPPPKIVSAIYTSHITQRIGEKLGFKRVKEIEFSRWSFNGKTYTERIGPETKCTTLEYYTL